MSPVYLNPQHSSSMPFLELKGDQVHNHSLSLVGHLHDHHVASIKNAYFSHANFDRNSAGVQAAIDYDYSRRAQEKVEKLVISQAKPIDHSQILASPQQLQYTPDGSGCSHNSHNHPFDKKIGSIDQTANIKQSKKCKPTKLRIMHKMTATSNKSKITGDHHHHHHHHLAEPHQISMYRNTANHISNGRIRVCTDCHTTTTPLWRSGPHGPKSLCNACGIRQRKARRAAMAAAAAAELTNNATAASPTSASNYIEAPKPKVEELKPERKVDHHTLPIKKRSKMTNHASWNYNNNGDRLSFEDFAFSSSKNYFTDKSERAFPRDEEEGAILLMALSCGLACSS